ncbi:hypothetical protein ElyMa_003220700 [Elysia marginata]|uniref:WAPL domain-containing protein n=1 Tax=Elysia marginata TaxID=1093978 RepID=A0AAV4J7Z8_9GAST|nr:hypothetical protein ElyMa_003220700 [Elysia marginata]
MLTPNRVLEQLKREKMPGLYLTTIYIFTVALLPFINAQNGDNKYKPSQHSWRSRSVAEHQNAPVRPYAPLPAAPPIPPASQQGYNRLSDNTRFLGERYPPVPAAIRYNPGYQPETPSQYNPVYNPSQRYNPNQNHPSINPSIGYLGGQYVPRPTGNQGYPNNYNDQRPNPNPAVPYWQRFSPGLDPRLPVTNPMRYLDPSRRVPAFEPNPTVPITDPERPYMRPAPKEDDIDDRARETQNSAWNKWAADLIGGPSFWDKTRGRDGRPTTTTTTTTTPPPKEAAPTLPPPRVDPNFFKSDGSVNTNRMGMMQAADPVDEDTVRDRGGNTAYDLFMSLLGRNFFTESANRARGKSNDEAEDAVPRPKQPLPLIGIPKTTTYPPMFDKPFKDIPHDFFEETYRQKDRDDSDEDDGDDSPQRSPRSGNDEDDGPPKLVKRSGNDDDNGDGPPEKSTRSGSANNPKSDDSEKHFTSEGKMFQSEVYSDSLTAVGTKLSSVNGKEASQEETKKDIIACVDTSLLEVLESPSCDDVTDHLSNVLLSQGNRSCLAKASNFCVLLETPIARYNLAKVFAHPKGREVFMLRLLVNLGAHTNMCKGPGANIFLLDLLSNVMHRHTTYTMPNGQPMPVFEP